MPGRLNVHVTKSNMKILVTGSSGFIGSNLVKRLTADNHQVVGWDIVDGKDVCDPALKEENLDAIFHAACPVNPANYQQVALGTIRASVIGTENILKLARQEGAKFLYISSSEVYGDIYHRPFKENDLVCLNPLGVRTFYDASKLLGEVLTMFYHRYFGVNVRIIRPFNIYGPGMRMDDNRVIPSFMRKVRYDLPVQVTGKGDSTRTFCYIDDFIEGLIRAMFYQDTNGEVFNLGTTELVTINKLAKILNAKVEVIDERVGEQKNRKPNISKAKKLLNWKPTISLKEGLELTWKSYQ